MPNLRPVLALLAAALLYPPLLPAVVILLSVSQPVDRGAKRGLLGGFLAWLAGLPPWSLLWYTLLGSAASALCQRPMVSGTPAVRGTPSFWRTWLLSVPLLLAMVAAQALSPLVTGVPVTALLPILGTTVLLHLSLYPPSWLLCRLTHLSRRPTP